MCCLAPPGRVSLTVESSYLPSPFATMGLAQQPRPGKQRRVEAAVLEQLLQLA
jgi:hypothetical protein